MMKRFLSLFIMAVFAPFGASLAQQRTTPAVSTATTGTVDTARIVSAFTAKETEFRQALNQYGFKRDVIIQTIGQGGQVTGEYHRTSDFAFDDKGNRYERIIFFPQPTLTELVVSQQDLDDLGGIQPYALEASKMGEYNFTYMGKERIDELNLHVFEVAPKVMPDPKKTKERYFKGRIWVDDQDLQIVKVKGRAIPETKDAKYPSFETYREQIDGRYWFPTYTYTDEDIVFDNGDVAHIRMAVRYTEYKKFGSKVKIIEVDEPPPPDEKEKKP